VNKHKKQKQKIRAEFRKRHETRRRKRDFTQQFARDPAADTDELAAGERVSGKGDLTRKRTVVGAQSSADESGLSVAPAIDPVTMRHGRVLRIHGLASVVETDDGSTLRCATRGLLKSLSTDQRHVLAVGDFVWFRPVGSGEGVVERIEPRQRVLSRTSRGRQHVLVANVDQLLIVSSAAEPVLKPNLIDRLLVTGERSRIRPIICINKVDLVDPAELQPMVGVYGQMGYRILLVSMVTRFGLERLRHVFKDQATVLAGQSGVGKSSLLNAIEPELNLRVRTVSQDSQKGRHTTTGAQLIPLKCGGYVVDTPGVRQFQLWDVSAAEVAGFYRDVRPWVNHCRYPNCTHIHEDGCAVKDAVADGRLDARRYASYCHLFAGEDA